MRIAVGLTTAADARAAAAEAALLAREPLIAATPTLAVLVTTPHHAPDARGVLQVVREFAQPNALVGCVAEAMVAGRREVEGEPAGWCLGSVPVAGFFAAGELGPVAGKNYLHGFIASMALFVDD